MRLSEIYEDFLIAKEVEEGCSKTTVRAYRYDLEMLSRVLDDPPLDSIKVFQVRKMLKILHSKNYSKQGVARKIACYKSFFNFCVDNELLEKSPMHAIKTPHIRPEEALPKYLSEEEIMQIFHELGRLKSMRRAWSDRLEVILHLLYASMARISEICSLRVQDLDLKRQLIKVRGKGNKERYIPIDQSTVKLIKEYLEERFFLTPIQDGFLFMNSHGNPIHPRTIQRDLQELKSLLNLPEEKKLTPHIFRHTGATHLRQHGMDISELQDLLGHASPNTTRIYAKNDVSRLAESYAEFHPLAQENFGKQE